MNRVQKFPQVEISNGLIRAKLYLPDLQRGYYRGTRFDWSGIVRNLEYRGHSYFGKWFEHHDPSVHDAITGPVEEFHTNGGLGYEGAASGETFIRIGVGAVRKPQEPAYRQFHTYEIVNPYKWDIQKGPNWIQFIHEVNDKSGYSYLYRKTVRLGEGRPELLLEHALRNTGIRPIETSVYNHNFFVIDRQPSGPDFVVSFPFDIRATADLQGLAEVRGRRLVYLQELQKDQTIYTPVEGFSRSADDYNITIENAKAGAGVRIRGDRPLSKLAFWSVRTTLCPESYVTVKVEPGRESSWKIVYEFYTL